MYRITIFFLCIGFIFGFSDNDLDGVENIYDQCPNTSFDDLVNQYGCPIEQYWGKLNLEIEHISQTQNDITTTLHDYYINYQYNNWLLSVSQNYYNNNKFGDLFTSIGYTSNTDNMIWKSYIGLKLAANDNTISTTENDYFMSVSMDYTSLVFLRYFVYLQYILTGNSKTINYANNINYSVGISYLYSNNEYQLSYQNSGSKTSKLNQYQNININWIHDFTYLHTSIGYNQSLIDSQDYYIYFGIGVNFE